MQRHDIVSEARAADNYISSLFYALPILEATTQPNDLLLRYETFFNVLKWETITQIKEDTNGSAISNFLNRHVTGFRLFDNEKTAKKYNNENKLTDIHVTHYQPVFLVQLVWADISLQRIIEELCDKQKDLTQDIEPSYQVKKDMVKVRMFEFHWTAPNEPMVSRGGMRVDLGVRMAGSLLEESRQSNCTIL